MKNPLTLAGIEPATFQFAAQHLNHCATPVPLVRLKQFHAILTETLGEHATSYATVKNWVAKFPSWSG